MDFEPEEPKPLSNFSKSVLILKKISSHFENYLYIHERKTKILSELIIIISRK